MLHADLHPHDKGRGFFGNPGLFCLSGCLFLRGGFCGGLRQPRLLPFLFSFLPSPLLLCFRLRRVAPCDASGQVGQQMLAGGGKFIAV